MSPEERIFLIREIKELLQMQLKQNNNLFDTESIKAMKSTLLRLITAI